MFCFVLIAIIGVGTGPASAEVEVRPKTRLPSVIIDADRVEKRTRVPRVKNALSQKDRRTRPREQVEVDCSLAAEQECRTTAAGTVGAEPEEAELTEGDILTAVREIGLPRLAVTIEPGDSTLVNARTNFYTDPQAFARSITLLDFDIDLAADPIRYTWVHGDATSRATSSPGRPYPNLDVTHRYREPRDVVRPRVDVTYRVRYRVDGGAWATIGQTLTATGPTADLEVNEAAPVLTAP